MSSFTRGMVSSSSISFASRSILPEQAKTLAVQKWIEENTCVDLG